MFNIEMIDASDSQSVPSLVQQFEPLRYLRTLPGYLLFFTGIFVFLFQLSNPVQASVTDKQQKVLQQKLFLLNNMVTRGATVKKIRSSGNPEAIELLGQAEDLYHLAKTAIDEGNGDGAAHMINDAIRMISSANSKARGKKGSTAMERDRYQELLANIDSLQTSAEDDFTTNVDLEPVIKLKEEAKELSKTDKYDVAIKKLNSAYQYIVTEMAGNVKNTTVVYSLDFKTSKDEYEYEFRRYQGNRELIDKMLLEHDDNPTRRLIVSYTQKADTTRNEAKALASNADHDKAVDIMEKANRELSRSLGMLGLRF